MTLLNGKPVKRQIPRPIERRDYCVEMDAIGIRFREKGKRSQTPPVPWESIFVWAMELSAEQVRQAKKK